MTTTLKDALSKNLQKKINFITKKDSDKVKTNLKIYVSFTLKEPNATAYDKMLTNVSKYISLSP